MVDADELLVRMRRARDWANSEAERNISDSVKLAASARENPDADQAALVVARTSAAVQAASFAVVRDVLDEILNPGKHSG
ncbi:hypothetical protein ABIA33_006700 [Streptacidiphilus sp. MAP12-16]|uniref:3-deoxy-D-manno-octulosonic acid transferase n=1 Tax=Streptacidiphilus sp. MAP12-16 TaxID=3156300 RepID=UPI0035118560